jgi:hypothetical protein
MPAKDQRPSLTELKEWFQARRRQAAEERATTQRRLTEAERQAWEARATLGAWLTTARLPGVAGG